MNDTHTKIALIEQALDYHNREIKRLDKISLELSESLLAIKTTLNQIKWIAAGVALTTLANELGLVAAIKAVI